MEKKFIRYANIALCLFILAGMIFVSACSKKEVKDESTITIGISQMPIVTTYRPNHLTEYLEKMNDVKLDFVVLPYDRSESRTKISLMASAGDLPEVLIDCGLASGWDMVYEWGQMGLLLPIEKYFEDSELMPNFNKIPPDERVKVLSGLKLADGHIYGFPRFEALTFNMTPYRMYINKAWLDQLGLQMPSTTDELLNVLIAFRDGDPNGNGKKDEIGIWGTVPYAGYGEDIIAAIINSFIYFNKWHLLSVDSEGKNVIAPFTQPVFRHALRYLNKLYKNGVLDAGTFTADTQVFRAVLNTTPPIVGLTSMGGIGHYPDADNNPNFLQMALMPPLSSPYSPGYTPFHAHITFPYGYITNKAEKNIEKIIRFIDSFYDDTVSRMVMHGEENVDWTKDPAILKGLTNSYVEQGIYPGITTAIINNILDGPNNKFWGQMNPRYAPFEMGEAIAYLSKPYDPNRPSEKIIIQNYEHYHHRHPVYLFPENPAYDPEGAKIAARTKVEVQTFYRSSVAEFTVGVRDIDSDADWNAYLSEMNNVGLGEWIRVAQQAWDRGDKPRN